MTDTTDIVLAGKSFPIRTPLTLGQLIDLRVGSATPVSDSNEENMRRTYSRAKSTIIAALHIEHPEITSELLDEMQITEVELFAAVGHILEISGLAKRPAVGDGAKAPGEEPAEA